MAQPSDNLRDRLPASRPQAENLTTDREEAAATLAKHQRALRWDPISVQVLLVVSFVLFYFWSGNRFYLAPQSLHCFQFASAATFVIALSWGVRYRIYKSEIETLKDLKQDQLQILEMQASLQKGRQSLPDPPAPSHKA